MATLSNTSFFSPTQISGCALWLDAADANSIVRTGSSVSQWNDKSGNGYNASNAVSANQPLYVTSSSGNYLSFNGTSSQFLGFTNPNALVANTTFTVIFVEKRQNINANYILGGSATVNANLHTGYASETNIRFGFYGNDLDFSPFSSYNTSNEPTRLWAFDYNGSTRSIILNSSTLVSSNNSTNLSSWANGSIGNFRNAAYYTGNLYEMLIYKPSLSTNQRQQIEGYLAWKWGLQSNLPSSHPFYNYNPSVPNINLFTPTTVLTSPLQVSGCALWLDAGDSATIFQDSGGTTLVTSNGQSIGLWRDKSGNLRNATQGTLSNRPTFSSSNIRFTVSGLIFNFLSVTGLSASSTNENAFIVLTPLGTGSGGTATLLGSSATGGRQFRYGTTSLQTIKQYLVNLLVTNLNSYTNGAASMYEFTNDNTTLTHYQSGSPLGSTGSTSYTVGLTTVIGVNGSDGSLGSVEGLNANINEIIIYNTTLTTAQRQQVEGYLAWKWGLQSSLPTTHPFYNFNPSAPLLIQLATLPIVQSNTTLITMNPTQISGCALWLDAADANSIVLSGSNVSQWKDKSGNSRDTTATALTSTYNTNVLNGLNGIVITSNTPPAFTTSSSSPFVLSATSQISAFIILNFSSQTNYIDFMAAFPNRNNFMMGTDGAPIYPYNTYINNVNNYFSYNFPVNTTRIVELVYNGVSPALTSYINGSQIGVTTTPSPGTSLTTSQRIQVFNPNGVMTMTGQVFELLFYSRNLSTSERQQIEGYLAWKWGLQANLPTSHPYYFNPLIPNLVLQSQLLSMTPSFSPLRFSGTSLWLDAADPASVITSGNLVTQWNDKSGNGTNATTTAASNFPQYSQSSLNNLGTLRFNGASGTPNFLDTPAFDFGTSTRTVFFVMRNTGPLSGTASSPHWFWSKTGNGTNALAIVGWMQFRANATDIMYDATRNTYLLICFRFGTTTGFEELFNNGTLVASATKSSGGTSYANATAGYRLGWLTSDPTLLYYFDGNIAEVLLYKTAVTNSQRQQIEGYLAWKWGLQSSLPANHPYVLFPPS